MAAGMANVVAATHAHDPSMTVRVVVSNGVEWPGDGGWLVTLNARIVNVVKQDNESFLYVGQGGRRRKWQHIFNL